MSARADHSSTEKRPRNSSNDRRCRVADLWRSATIDALILSPSGSAARRAYPSYMSAGMRIVIVFVVILWVIDVFRLFYDTRQASEHNSLGLVGHGDPFYAFYSRGIVGQVLLPVVRHAYPSIIENDEGYVEVKRRSMLL